ncbi:MAG: hypothetical protein CL897_02530 [Dehalococcoidia bacterium]|nr:hypothetical protein [Dehalococcoidia bacterium]HCV00222.1 hypothetical protein [Dehalococcoidia bacterium]
MSDELHCSWDSTHEPEFGAYTTTNAEEVLPGVTKPLAADIWREWDYVWNYGVTEDLGTDDLLEIPKPPLATTLPFIGGRFVINYGLNMAFTAQYSVGEGSDFLKQFLEGGDALKSEAGADEARAIETRKAITQRWENAEELINKNRELSVNAYRESRTRNWSTATENELLEALDAGIELAGRIFMGHYYNSVGGGEYTTEIGKILDEHLPDRPPEWTNSITSGLTGVESALPAKAIWDLSRAIAERPDLATEFTSLTADNFLSNLATPPSEDWHSFAEKYAEFIQELGFRGQNETNPSYRTWDEAPNFVLSSIQADLNATLDRDPHELERKQSTARLEIEREIEAKLPAEVLNEFRHALQLAQTLNRGRESSKANWARACRTQRPPVVELGERLAAKGVLLDAEDVWFLRLPELRKAADGNLDSTEAKSNIAARKVEFVQMEQHELPVMFDWPVDLIPKEAAVAVSTASYEGLGVSPGQASGKARVIESAEAAISAMLEPGEILIAPVTDAAWTPLFIPAAGVVVETGGILSHAATVAREFGIPAVAQIRGITSLIPNGATVTIDGTTGTVTVEP